MSQFIPASVEKNYHISTQGFQSKNLFLDISPNGDGFAITFKTPHDYYKLFFSPTGQITHVRHHDAQDAMATAPVVDADKSYIRPRP